MSWKKLLESISESVDDRLRLRNAYLVAENRILRNQIDGRVPLADSERKELAALGAKLGRKALEENRYHDPAGYHLGLEPQVCRPAGGYLQATDTGWTSPRRQSD